MENQSAAITVGKEGGAFWNKVKRFENVKSHNATAWAAAILRLGLGIVFIAHALLKLLVLTLPGTVAFFEAHGFPGWTAYPVFAAELIGGIFLIAGILPRLTAVGLIPIMIGAFFTHYPNGWSFTNAGGGWEYVAFLNLALIVQALLGGGFYSLETLFFKRSGE